MWRYGLIAFLCIVFSSFASAQQVLKTSSGAVVGTKMVVSTKAPYCLLFPDGTCTGTELIALARKINNLGANVLVVPSETPYTDANVSADVLVNDMGWRIEELRKTTSGPLFLMAQKRVSAAALIAATRFFAIKGVIAVSTGEYFAGKEYVAQSLTMLRVPVLSLCTEGEFMAVKGVFAKLPRKFVVFSTDLEVAGYNDLLKNTKQAGKIWLAISVFYHEHFDN